jgi:hypothetical protein
MYQKIKTDKFSIAAFLLADGCELLSVQLPAENDSKLIYRISGENLTEKKRLLRKGDLVVSPNRLNECLNSLREIESNLSNFNSKIEHY